MTRKSDTQAPQEREMTDGERAADAAHRAAHQRATQEEAERNQIIKDRIAAGSPPEPGTKPSEYNPTPQQAGVPRAADVFPVRPEQHGGAVVPESLPAADAKADSKKH